MVADMVLYWLAKARAVVSALVAVKREIRERRRHNGQPPGPNARICVISLGSASAGRVRPTLILPRRDCQEFRVGRWP